MLAATGLLDGGTATTHWRHAEALRKRHPEIDVDDASLYREHDRIFTSAGSAAGMDLLIEIVRQDFGALAANSVARRLVMPAHRTGGQAQFLERPVTRREGTAISPVLDRMRASLAAEWTIERMAAECRMSPRTFLRRFAEATGATPGDWLTMERVAAAKNCSRKERQASMISPLRSVLEAPTRSAIISARRSASARRSIAGASSSKPSSNRYKTVKQL